MRLYLLQRDFAGIYDEVTGFVVRAPNATEARRLAAQNAGDEGADFWRDGRQSSCRELTADGEAEVVVAVLHHG